MTMTAMSKIYVIGHKEGEIMFAEQAYDLYLRHFDLIIQ